MPIGQDAAPSEIGLAGTLNLLYCRAFKLKGHEIGRSPYLLKTQKREIFYGNFSRRKNSPQQPLSCDYTDKTCERVTNAVGTIFSKIFIGTRARPI